MAAKKYSAGAIFLQVVPVFANVQRAIEDEAKNIDRALGDSMEKSGEKAGQRAGKAASKALNEELRKSSGSFEREFHKNIEGINQALGSIDTKRLSNDLRRELAAVKKELAGLKDVDIVGDADFKRVYNELTILEQRVRGLRDGAKIVFRSDIDDALKGFAKVQAAKESIEDPVEIKVRADTATAMREMTSFEKSFKKVAEKAASHLSGSMSKEAKRIKQDLRALQDLRIGVDISANRARQELGELMDDLNDLSRTTGDIDVKVDSARAFSELAAFKAQVDKIDGDDISVDVRVDGVSKARRDADQAANSFRSFNLILLAATGAGPALIPILAGIAGGLLALGPAAAVATAGLGSVLVGFSGIGDALGALQDRQDAMAMSTQQAARTEQSSAAAVASARRSAARAVESALDAQADAQRRYRDSIEDVRDAEEALRQAREAARGTGDDLDLQIRQNDLAIDQALLDSFNATVTFNSVMADGSATNAEKEQARIDREAALLALEELRDQQKELAKEKRKWDREGVNGTEQVQSAQDALQDAIERQKDAYRDLGEAAEAVDQARADGARNVAEAMRSQADAMESISTQQNNVNNAFAKLGPAGQAFALFLFGLRDEFYAFRDDIQTVLLPAVQQAIEGFFSSSSASTARTALIGLAEGFGEFAKALSVSLQGPAWLGFFEMLRDVGPSIQASYGAGFIAFMEGIASILTTLAPFALEFAEGFRVLMERFAEWAASPEGQEQILEFLGYVRDVAPAVMDFFKTLAGTLTMALVALAPYAAMVLDLITGLFEAINDLDPRLLGVFLGTIIALVFASQVAYGVMNLLMAGAALVGSTLGLVVFGLIAFALAVIYLWRTSEDFRDIVKSAWGSIRDVIVDAWEKHLKPALIELGNALLALWDDVLRPFIMWLGPILLWVAKKILPILMIAFSIVIKAIARFIVNILVPAIHRMVDIFKWAWNRVLKPLWNAMAAAAKWLWEKALKPAFGFIGDAWDTLGDGIKWVWNKVIKPVWDFIADRALPKLKGAFETAVDGIQKIWDGLKKVVGAPIKFVLDTIINNGLIDGFNKVAGWVGMDGFKHIPIPDALQSYATGGVLPGYTPGRDVHKFVSPTAGRLELSGGEAIMRPEFTAAVGSDYVNQMNAIARTGGVRAVRQAMAGLGGYYLGGVLPLPGGSVVAHTSGYKGYAADLNYPGYADYGAAVKAWKDGIVAQMNYIGDQSYGRWAVLNHGAQSSLYAHLSNFAKIAVGQKVRAGQTIGYVGDIGNTGNPPTSHLHFEVNGGAVGFSDTAGQAAAGGRRVPSWLMGVVKDPLAAVKGWVTDKWSSASDLITESPVFDAVKKVPLLAAKKVTDKVWDVIPGWVKSAAGWAGDAAGWAVGGIKDAAGMAGDIAGGIGANVADGAGAVADFLGFADGGILPYNGTMKYDAGGYLPPGLTSVVNLTGKPEPVFTNDQWADMEKGGEGGNIHYEPHFEGSNLTSEDVAGDLNFTFRRLSRGGKYEGVGS